ncbi:GTPase, partial [Dankookia rubra]
AGPLARHNLPAPLAARLASGPLDRALAAALGFAALPDAVAAPLLLVGPPGAGKTLSCVKLATRAVLDGGAPLVVTTDGARAGAAEQLAAFTRVLGLTLSVAPQPAALAKAVSRRSPGQAVLIDSAGCDPFDPAQAGALLELARVAGATLLLVLPAGLDPAEAAETAQAFRALGARHLLPTRLDAARRLGGVLAAAAAGLALTEAGLGQDPAGDLAPVDPAWLAARLLRAAKGDA